MPRKKTQLRLRLLGSTADSVALPLNRLRFIIAIVDVPQESFMSTREAVYNRLVNEKQGPGIMWLDRAADAFTWWRALAQASGATRSPARAYAVNVAETLA